MYKIRNISFIIALLAMLVACDAITGREMAGEYIDDSTITAKVKTAILDDPDLRIMQISVETLKGEVQLSGFVDSKHKAIKAEQDALKVKGVKSVRNNLIVKDQ